MHWYLSPFLIPLAGILVAIVAIVSGVWGQAHARRVKADQRMTMLARGVPLAEIDAVLHAGDEKEKRTGRDPLRSLANSRRIAVVLISGGIGITTFFVALALILRERDVYSGAAIGLIPLAIGLGFVADYSLQRREMARYGWEMEADRSLR